ncbi:MAG: hypothetical protein U0939_26230 [Pirellulales bacterium]
MSVPSGDGGNIPHFRADLAAGRETDCARWENFFPTPRPRQVPARGIRRGEQRN